MRAKDVKTGVLYAYQTSKRIDPVPVMVLDLRIHAQSRVVRHLDRKDVPIWRLMQNITRAGGARYDEIHYGFPALSILPLFPSRMDKPGDIKDLSRFTYEHVNAAMTAAATRKPVPGTGVYPLVVNPTYIVGEWEEVSERVADEKELAENLAAADLARKTELAAAKQQRIDALRALNLPGTLADAPKAETWGFSEKNATQVVLSIAQVDALLSLIPEGAVVVEQWEYAEGQR